MKQITKSSITLARNGVNHIIIGNKILVQAKKKYVDIGEGFYVSKVGKDANGNSSVWVSKGSGRAKKIQINGVVSDKSNVMSEKLKYFDNQNDPKVKKTIKEIKDYYKKYLK